MTTSLEELEKLAKAATPGPWGINRDFYAGYHYYISSEQHPQLLYLYAKEDKGHRYCNGEFISAANPATVLKLIERIRGLEQALVKIQQEPFWVLQDNTLVLKTLPIAKICEDALAKFGERVRG